MAQLYLLDSGYMIHQGLSEMEYRAWADFDDTKHGIEFSAQIFPLDWLQQRALNQRFWFFVPEKGEFVSYDPTGEHWLIQAASELFTELRWEEIYEAIEEQGNFNNAVNKLKMSKCQKLIDKAEHKGLITTAERDTLFTVFA